MRKENCMHIKEGQEQEESQKLYIILFVKVCKHTLEMSREKTTG